MSEKWLQITKINKWINENKNFTEQADIYKYNTEPWNKTENKNTLVEDQSSLSSG